MKTKLLIWIIFSAFVCLGGAILYKKNFGSGAFLTNKVYIHASKSPGITEDMGFVKKSLNLYNIKNEQIKVNGKEPHSEKCVEIFFDQDKFDEEIKHNDSSSLKIAVKLRRNFEESQKVLGVFVEDKSEALLEFIESTVKRPINCILFFDETDEIAKQIAEDFLELSKIKELDLKICPIKSNRNVATLLKEESQNMNAAILIASPLVLAESEIIIEYFTNRKIPVFSNHAGLIRNGAIGGFDFDTQEIAHSIAEVASTFFKNPNDIRDDLFEELYPQLHLNVDAIAKLGIKPDPDLLDEAITVGGADL